MKKLFTILALLLISSLAQAGTVHSLRTKSDGNIVAAVKGSGDSTLLGKHTCSTVTVGGSFTGGTITVCKSGRMVTLISNGSLTHNSSSEVVSNIGLIPELFRPDSIVLNVYHHASAPNGTFQIRVDTDGKIVTQYFDWAGSLRSRIDTNGSVSISYIVN